VKEAFKAICSPSYFGRQIIGFSRNILESNTKHSLTFGGTIPGGGINYVYA
jgi:hypothetical protein